jgi:3'-phosphoadenosine 5'-phosphosulfate sulfotransferase (PAPS reductase)/FAD synthetase
MSAIERLPIAVVSVSGGKDSQATANLAIERYGKDRVVLVHADTGHEHEATVEFVRHDLPAMLGLPIHIVRADFSAEISRKRLYVEHEWPKKGVTAEIVARALSVLHPTSVPFLDLCLWKGRFPSRMRQFCTRELKRRPLDALMLELMSSGELVESWQGVRRDESLNRADVPDWEWAAEGWKIVRPIAGWSAEEVVASVLALGQRLNPLYSQGCSRVGCMLCINASKDDVANCARRFPQHIERIKEWESLVGRASKRGFSTLFAVSGDPTESDEVVYGRFNINSIVEWSMTSRGGKQFDLFRAVAEPPSCSSIYGLCE